jgi:hypothetical protein
MFVQSRALAVLAVGTPAFSLDAAASARAHVSPPLACSAVGPVYTIQSSDVQMRALLPLYLRRTFKLMMKLVSVHKTELNDSYDTVPSCSQS